MSIKFKSLLRNKLHPSAYASIRQYVCHFTSCFKVVGWVVVAHRIVSALSGIDWNLFWPYSHQLLANISSNCQLSNSLEAAFFYSFNMVYINICDNLSPWMRRSPDIISPNTYSRRGLCTQTIHLVFNIKTDILLYPRQCPVKWLTFSVMCCRYLFGVPIIKYVHIFVCADIDFVSKPAVFWNLHIGTWS